MSLTTALLALCISATAADASADEPWLDKVLSVEPAAVLKAASASKAPSGADVEILLSEATFEFDEQGRMHRTTRLIYRLLHESAVADWSVVRATWSPWHQERPLIQARVIAADGSAYVLEPETVAEGPVSQKAELLSDRRMLHAPLPGVAAGAVVEEQITIHEVRPFFAAGAGGQFDFWAATPTRHIRLSIKAPEKLPLRYETLAIKLEPKRTIAKTGVTLQFDLEGVQPGEVPEPMMPADMPRRPHVVFSSARSWADIADAYRTFSDAQRVSDTVKALALEAIGEEKSREKIAAKLLTRVQKLVRYTGLEFGASAIVPHSPDETLGRRYGDCKDQSTLLVDLLRAAGQQASIALLSVGSSEDIQADLPAMNFFNHAIVYMPGEPAIWIDPTAPYLRCGELPLGDQGRLALIIAPGTNGLLRTPPATSAANYLIDTREFHLSEPMKTRICRKLEAGGSIENSLRSGYAPLRPSQVRDYWDNYVERTYRTKQISQFKYGDPTKLDTPFHLNFEATNSNLGQIGDLQTTVSLAPSSVLAYLPYFLTASLPEAEAGSSGSKKPAHSKRRTPLALTDPYKYELTYRVTPPAGYRMQQLPPDETVHFGSLSLDWTFTKDSQETVTACIRFDAGDGKLQPANVDAFRKWIIAQRGEHWAFVLKFSHQAQEWIEQRKFRQGFAEFRELLSRHPDDAGLESRYARALLAGGFGTAARLHARRSVQLAPQNSECWHALGFILTYDEVGRHFKGNFDWSGAASAYQKSLELNPANHRARWNDAILLEHDLRGFRYTSDARLDKALAQYRKIRETNPDNEDVNHAFLFTLLYAGRFAEIKQQAAGMRQTPTINAMLLTAIAVEEGVEKCLAAAREKIPSAEQRRSTLADTASYLDKSRHYEITAQLLQSLGGNDAEVKRNESIAKVLMTLPHIEKVRLPQDDPRSVVQQLYVALVMSGTCDDATARLFAAPCARQPYQRAERVQVQLHPVSQRAEQQSTPPQRRTDVVSLMKFESTGTDETGYRVFATYPGLPASSWYVVKTADGYRIWDVAFDVGELGQAALELLEQNRLEEARQYLRWAWEDLREKLFTFDPFAGTPFGRMWLGSDHSKPEELRLMAALLAVNGPGSSKAVEIVKQERERRESKLHLLQLDRALIAGLLACDLPEEALPVADRILAAFPTAVDSFSMKGIILVRLGRFDEARLLSEQRYKQAPNEIWARRLLSDLAAERNDFSSSEKYLREGIKSDPGGYFANTIAWNALYCTPLPSEAIKDASRAVETAPTPAALHTLATVYAELGQTDAARQNLNRCIEARGYIDNVDWYVHGRIAEQDGCPEIARESYRKVTLPTTRWLTTTYELAQRRLKVLGPR